MNPEGLILTSKVGITVLIVEVHCLILRVLQRILICTLKTEQRKKCEEKKSFQEKNNCEKTIFAKKRQERESHKNRSSYKERKGNALAPGAEEGRS